MTSFLSYGQIVIRDSSLVPTKWLVEGMKDLKRYDLLKVEDSLRKISENNLRKSLLVEKKYTKELTERNTELETRYNLYKETALLNEKIYIQQIDGLVVEINKEKRRGLTKAVSGTLGGLIIGVITGMIIFK